MDARPQLHILYWFDLIRSLPVTVNILILGAGLIFLTYGRAVFRMALILNAALIAGYVGWYLGLLVDRPRLVAALLALAFAILAWPMFKIAVACTAGLLGTIFLVAAFSLVTQRVEYMVIAVAAGFICFAVLGWYLINPAVVGFTALQGSAMLVLGGLALIERTTTIIVVSRWPDRAPWVLMVILALAVVGALFQLAHMGKQRVGEPLASPPAQQS